MARLCKTKSTWCKTMLEGCRHVVKKAKGTKKCVTKRKIKFEDYKVSTITWSANDDNEIIEKLRNAKIGTFSRPFYLM